MGETLLDTQKVVYYLAIGKEMHKHVRSKVHSAFSFTCTLMSVCRKSVPFLSGSSWGGGDVASAVTSVSPSAPSFPANISSRLLSSSEICSTFRFVSATRIQYKKGGMRICLKSEGMLCHTFLFGIN